MSDGYLGLRCVVLLSFNSYDNSFTSRSTYDDTKKINLVTFQIYIYEILLKITARLQITMTLPFSSL